MKKIVEYNNKSFSKVDVLADLWEHNSSIEKKELTNLINSISSIPKEERFNRDGNTMDKDYYNSLLNNLNLDSLSDTNAIKYGITIERTNFRTFPPMSLPIGNRETLSLIDFKKQQSIHWNL